MEVHHQPPVENVSTPYWKIGEEFQDIGELKKEYKKADIGIVVSPRDIVDRLKTGQYHFSYPKY